MVIDSSTLEQFALWSDTRVSPITLKYKSHCPLLWNYLPFDPWERQRPISSKKSSLGLPLNYTVNDQLSDHGRHREMTNSFEQNILIWKKAYSNWNYNEILVKGYRILPKLLDLVSSEVLVKMNMLSLCLHFLFFHRGNKDENKWKARQNISFCTTFPSLFLRTQSLLGWKRALCIDSPCHLLYKVEWKVQLDHPGRNVLF